MKTRLLIRFFFPSSSLLILWRALREIVYFLKQFKISIHFFISSLYLVFSMFSIKRPYRVYLRTDHALYKIMNNNLGKNYCYGMFSWQYIVIFTMSSDQKLYVLFFFKPSRFFPVKSVWNFRKIRIRIVIVSFTVRIAFCCFSLDLILCRNFCPA